MHAEIHLLIVGSPFVDSKLKTEKSTARGRRDVDIDGGVTHFKILQDCRSSGLKEETPAALVVSRLGPSL
jgi:hypothetical protein